MVTGMLWLPAACATTVPAGTDVDAGGPSEVPTYAPSDPSWCDAPTRYVLTYARSECADLVAPGGRWRPTAGFVEVPAEVNAHFCSVAWDGAAAPTEADRAVVLSRDDAATMVRPLCADEPAQAPERPLRVADTYIVITPAGGSIGCDVCKPNGVVWKGRLFAVLPTAPANTFERTAFVRRADGLDTLLGFTPAKVSAVLVEVPLPAGETFEEGLVAVE